MACEECIDEDGNECLPQYGLAPHVHLDSEDGQFTVTVFTSKEDWPDNFKPDPDVENMGTWYCEFCHTPI